MEYTKISSSKEIQECLSSFGDYYERVKKRLENVDEFVAKLALYGIVVSSSENGFINGVICFYANNMTDYCGYISIIWVKKEYQKKGIGKQLLDYSLSEMKKRGMKTVVLEVEKENKNAISFYMNNGFAIKSKARENSYYMMRTINL